MQTHKTTLFSLSMAVLILICGPVFASKVIDAPIKMVTVYPDQAQISRITELNLPAGEHTLVIDNLPAGIIDESFRAAVSDLNGLNLLGLNHKTVQLMKAPQEKLAELERQIERLETVDKRSLTDNLEAFNEQKKILFNISKSATDWSTGDSGKVNLDVTAWREAYSFIGGSIRDINDSIRTITNDITELDKKINKLKADLRSMQGNRTHASKTVEIDLMLEKPMKFELSLKYNIRGASWRPVYDARLSDDSKVRMICYADISQKTGEDWDDVWLTISTARPSQGTSPGELTNWYLSVIEQFREKKGVDYKAMPAMAEEKDEVFIRGGRAGEVSYMVDGVNIGSTAIVNANNFSFTFDCKFKKTIPSGDESEKTFVVDYNLESDMTYLCRPRNNEAVYRLAKVTNQMESPFLPGPVSIFAENDFIGKAFINNYIAPGEEFEIGFGQDNSFKVERHILAVKESHGSSLFGDEKIKKEQTISITLKYSGKNARTVKLEEALPVSTDDRIKVKLGDIAPKYDTLDEKGTAEWSVNFKPGEERKVTIPIKIEHESGIMISGL